MLRLVVSFQIVYKERLEDTASFSVALPSTPKFALCQEASAKKQNRRL